MTKEIIIRIWKFAYIRLIGLDGDYITPNFCEGFVDKKGTWDCSQIKGRFYFCKKEI
jgi:hypothetical protein